MPIRDNKRVYKTQPHIIRTVKKRVIQSNVKPALSIHERQERNKKNYGQVEKLWQNETVYIVGGGPSLKNFDWSQLNGKKVIAINRAFQVLPDADVLYWTDSRFWKWYKEDIKRFKGLKFTCRPYSPEAPDVTLLKAVNNRVLEMEPGHIAHGNNSGYAAINLAVKLGATKIYLLGYDMHSNKNQTHWHEGYDARHNHGIYSKMIKTFNDLAPMLKQMNIRVFNANPDSKLDVFNKCSLKSAINDSM